MPSLSRRILVLAVNRRIVPLPNDRRIDGPETGTDQRTGKSETQNRGTGIQENRIASRDPVAGDASRLLHRNRKKPCPAQSHLTVSGNSSANGWPHHKASGVYSLWVQYPEASSRRADCCSRDRWTRNAIDDRVYNYEKAGPNLDST